MTAYDGFLFQFKTGAAGYLWSERDGLVDPNVVLAPGFSDTILAANALNVHAPIAATRDDGGVNTQTVLLTPTGSIHWMGTGGGDFTDASKRDDSLGFSPSTKFLDHVLAPTDTSTVRVTANIETKSVQVGGGGGLLSLELANGATVRTTSGLGIASSGLLTGNGTIVGGVVNRGALEVSDVTISDGLENEATAKPVGSGKLTAALANKGSGHVEIDQGSQLRIDGSGHTNEGVMVVREGELSVSGKLTYQATGEIALDAAAFSAFDALEHHGLLAVSAGDSRIAGDVTTFQNGRVVVAGSASARFEGAVDVRSGGELRVEAEASYGSKRDLRRLSWVRLRR